MDIYILDKDFEVVDVLDSFESLIWTDRYSTYGDFELYTSANVNTIQMLEIGRYLQIESSKHTMIVENMQITTDVESGNHLTVTGRSIESLLTRRITYDTVDLDGYVEGQIQKLLNTNVISPTDSNRKIENFIFQTSNDESIARMKVDMQFTGDSVYDIISTICDSLGIGFKLIVEDDKMIFSLYNGQDRSYDQDDNPYVIFSPEFDNIINSDFNLQTAEYSNVAFVAGEGEGSNRVKVTVGATDISGIDRRELYVDARDLSSTNGSETLTASQYLNKLISRGNEKLNEAKIQETFEGQNETTILYKYDEDFFMGDIVQIENEFGMEARVRVVEFIRSEGTDSGSETYPTFKKVE